MEEWVGRGAKKWGTKKVQKTGLTGEHCIAYKETGHDGPRTKGCEMMVPWPFTVAKVGSAAAPQKNQPLTVPTNTLVECSYTKYKGPLAMTRVGGGRARKEGGRRGLAPMRSVIEGAAARKISPTSDR
jgi:hypothetical protein